ncbi:MAG: translational GTPase TypA, partial [Gammaproteobacteria bacterium]|nr:translational GTPase TypA [Gammaproteobacteria bacterium]
ALDYSSYVGAIGIGRVRRGQIAPNSPVTVIDRTGVSRSGRLLQVLGFMGLERVEVERAMAGDIVAVTGLGRVDISDTLCDPEWPEALPPLTVDEPTITMTFEVNTSPFAGRDGQFLTSRQLSERLQREALHNVALRVEDTDDPEKFVVSGRGELHLAIFLENMRREGYELAVSRPQVIYHERAGVREEPYEQLTLDVEDRHRGPVMSAVGERGGDLKDMQPDGRGRMRLDYLIPARGLIGFQSEFMGVTSGTGLMYHIFDHYGPVARGNFAKRRNGVLISMATGKTLAYALYNLQERGRLLVKPGDDVYEGQIVGVHSRDNDLTVNPLKAKQLTNIRAAAKDDNVLLKPPLPITLELGLEFIEDDELLEITPHDLRIRKRFLKEHQRRRAHRTG